MQGHYLDMPPELRSDILAFYHDPDGQNWTKANREDWAAVLDELGRLQAVDADLRHPSEAPASALAPK
jgi:hypothetical protein